MNLQLSSASRSAQTGWGSAVPTGIPEPALASQPPILHQPALAIVERKDPLDFQPPILYQPALAIAERKDWLDNEYREAYMEACVEQNIAWQIKFNREKRNVSQRGLAKIIGTQQSAISRLEDPSYGKLNLKSIIKIAHAFQCALSVRLISYSDLAEESKSFTKHSVIVEPFEEQIDLIQGRK